MPPGADTHTDYSCECGNFHLPMSAAGEPRTEAKTPSALAYLQSIQSEQERGYYNTLFSAIEDQARHLLIVEQAYDPATLASDFRAEAARQTEPRLDVDAANLIRSYGPEGSRLCEQWLAAYDASEPRR